MPTQNPCHLVPTPKQHAPRQVVENMTIPSPPKTYPPQQQPTSTPTRRQCRHRRPPATRATRQRPITNNSWKWKATRSSESETFVPALVDNKRKHLELYLSAAQRNVPGSNIRDSVVQTTPTLACLCPMQRLIQNPVKHIRGSFLRKWLTSFSR